MHNKDFILQNLLIWRIQGIFIWFCLSVFLFFTIIIFLLLFIIFLPFILSYYIYCIFSYSCLPSISQQQCNLYEEIMMDEMYPNSLKNPSQELQNLINYRYPNRKDIKIDFDIINDWINIPDCHGEIANIHSLIIKQKVDERKGNKPTLLFLHGFGGTAAISFIQSKMISHLYKQFDVYAVDLPGFGRSILPYKYIHTNLEDMKSILVDLIYEYIKKKELNDVYIVGHSFGGFIAFSITAKYPNIIKKLLVLDAPGYFPLPGTLGAYLGLVFTLGIPMYPLRSLGFMGVSIYYTLNWLGFANAKYYYWYQVQASKVNIADFIAKKFLKSKFYCYAWHDNQVAWKQFIDLNVPFAIGYGQKDNIAPPIQGIIMSLLCGSTIPIYYIENGRHVPMHLNEGVDLANLIITAYENVQISSIKSKEIINQYFSRINELEDFEKEFQGIFSVFSEKGLFDFKFMNLILYFYLKIDTIKIASLYYERLLESHKKHHNISHFTNPNIYLINKMDIKRVNIQELTFFTSFEKLINDHIITNSNLCNLDIKDKNIHMINESIISKSTSNVSILESSITIHENNES